MADKTLNIQIKTELTGKGAEQAKSEINQLNSEAEKLGSTSLGDLQGKIAGLLPVIGGMAAAWKGAQKALEEFAQTETKIAELDAALANNGTLTEDYRAKLQQLAGQLQETTAIADDQWLGALTTLTKFGADSTNIDQYSEAVKNLAGFLGGDIDQAAFIFGKAMQGSTEMLGRYGISVDKSTSQTEQLNSVMEQLAQRGGGQLEATAGTLTGQWQNLQNSTGDLFEAFGQIIASTGVLQTGIQGLTDSFRFWSEILGTTYAQTDGVTNKIILQGASAEETQAAISAYSTSLAQLGESNESATVKLRDNTQAIDDNLRSTLAIAKANRDLAIAKIEADSSLSNEDKAKQRGDIEAAYQSVSLQSEISAASDKIAAREAAIKQLEDAAVDRRDELARQRSASEQASAKESAAQESATEINSITAQIAEQQKTLAAARRAIVEEQNTDRAAGPNAERLGEAQGAERNAQRTIASLEAQKQKLGEVDVAARKLAETERAKLSALEKTTPDELKKNESLQKELSADNARDKTRAKSKQEIAAIEADTARVGVEAAAKKASAEDAVLAAKKAQLDIERLLNEAKAAGNQQEVERLETIKKTNDLGASGAKESRSVADPDSTFNAPGTNPGELIAGTNKRRGRSESDLSFDMSQAAANMGGPGGSLLDAYKANQTTPVGAINGKSNLSADPKSSASGGGAGEVKAAADALLNSGESLGGIGQELNSALGDVAAATRAAREKVEMLAKDLQAALAKVKALSQKL